MKIRTIITVLLLSLLAGAAVYAQDTSKQQKKKDKLEKEIEILNNQLKDNAKKSKNALNDLTVVRKKVSVRKQLVNESQKQIEELEGQIVVKQNTIDSLQHNLDTMSAYYNRLVRSAYRLRDSRLWYSYILASKNFSQASRRYGYMKGLSSNMNAQAKKMIDAKQEISREQEELGGLRNEAEIVKGQREKDLRALQKDERASASVVNQLNKDKKTYQKQLQQKQKQVEALNREIKRIIAEAVRAKKAKEAAAAAAAAKANAANNSGNTGNAGNSTSTSTATAGKTVSSELDVKLSSEFASNKGRLPWPVDGSVVDHFGQHNHPVYTSVKMPFNNGVTVAVSPGAKAKAVFEGTVEQIVVMPGYNQCVLVRHGNYFTFYCKLKSVAVKAGDKVSTGQVLGTVDTIAGETQMHFQLWKDTTPQNPESWLR